MWAFYSDQENLQAFARLAIPRWHILDLRPALRHATSIADEACVFTGDKSLNVHALSNFIRAIRLMI
jgi:hypothetical protein